MSRNTLVIESATSLSEAEVKDIVSALKVKDASVITKVVPSLIAGLRVQLKGKMIDLSLSSKLQQLEEHLGNNE